MRYYCKNCGSVVQLGDKVKFQEKAMKQTECPFCFIRNYTLLQIPDYETPEQYEKRTGEAYPDNGLVWAFNLIHGDMWISSSYYMIKSLSRRNLIIVVADPPVPPHKSWRPE